ncbi:MAG: hypothetical protein N3J91_01890 [Verrucomicrobiae bacterium]|nr:hypothetical protein [Verrucomicrobiae bacterium]
MNTPRLQQSGPDNVWGDAIHLNILVVCEDAACGAQARTVIARMLPLLPVAAEAHTTTMEFAAFGLQAVLGQLQPPDIVIVAAHGRSPLPETVKQWLESWAAGSHGLTCAMTAVIDRQNQAHPVAVEMMSYLKSLAQRSHVDWLEAGKPAFDETGQYRERLSSQATAVSSTLTEIIRTPRPRTWA